MPARSPAVLRVLALAVLGLVLGAGCALAGVWQVHRFGEKRQANADLRENVRQPGQPVDRVLAVGRPATRAVRYRTVTATGRYDVAGQALVRQRQVQNTPGFLVVTPLRTAAGPVLVVVRGFLAYTGTATATPPVPPPPAGVVSLTGRVQPGEPGAPPRVLPPGQIERIDVGRIAADIGARGYGGYLELVSSAPADRGLVAMPPPDLSNPAGGADEGQHLAYVVQWFAFGLLALSAPVTLPLLDRRHRRREQAERTALGDPDGAVPATPR